MTEGEATGVIGAVSDTANKLINSVPAQFLVLLVVNAVFILGLLWFLNEQAKSRERVLTPIVMACLQQVPIDVVERLLKAQGAPPTR